MRQLRISTRSAFNSNLISVASFCTRFANAEQIVFNIREMRFEEKEEFILENAMLISKCYQGGKNVFIYWAEGSYFKVEASPFSKGFEQIEVISKTEVSQYFEQADKRDLFFEPFNSN